MSHKMGIPKEKLLKALHKNEAHKQAERDVEDAMKYLNSGEAEEGSDEDSSIVPEKLDPEEVQRIAKERLAANKGQASAAAEDTNPKGGTEIKGMAPGGMGAKSEANIDLGSIGGNSLPRLQRNMSVHTVMTKATADTLAGSLIAPPFAFGVQKAYKPLGEYEISSKLLLGRKASGELEIRDNKSPKGKT